MNHHQANIYKKKKKKLKNAKYKDLNFMGSHLLSLIVFIIITII